MEAVGKGDRRAKDEALFGLANDTATESNGFIKSSSSPESQQKNAILIKHAIQQFSVNPGKTFVTASKEDCSPKFYLGQQNCPICMTFGCTNRDQDNRIERQMLLIKGIDLKGDPDCIAQKPIFWQPFNRNTVQ